MTPIQVSKAMLAEGAALLLNTEILEAAEAFRAAIRETTDTPADMVSVLMLHALATSAAITETDKCDFVGQILTAMTQDVFGAATSIKTDKADRIVH